MTLAKGEIVERVVTYVVKSIVEEPEEVSVTMVEQGPDDAGPGQAAMDGDAPVR